MLRNAPHVVYGIAASGAGLLAGGILTATAVGSGYWIFMIAAPVAAFLTGALFWYILITRRKGAGYPAALGTGLLTGLVSHLVCWYLLFTVSYLSGLLIGGGGDTVGPFTALAASAVYSVFSILFFGVLTVGWAVAAALILKRVMK